MKSPVFKMFSVHTKTQSRPFQIPLVCRVLSVFVTDFQISPACGRGLWLRGRIGRGKTGEHYAPDHIKKRALLQLRVTRRNEAEGRQIILPENRRYKAVDRTTSSSLFYQKPMIKEWNMLSNSNFVTSMCLYRIVIWFPLNLSLIHLCPNSKTIIFRAVFIWV